MIRRWLLLGLLLYLWLPAPLSAATVLIYHKFGEKHSPTTNVPVKEFREQMAYLAREGFRVVPLREIVEALRNHQPLPDRTVAITIDDAYRSIYTNAFPILREHGYPFTVFLCAKTVDEKYADYLSWDQVRELARQGVDFENHGYAHARYGLRPAGMDDDAYRGWIRDDIETNAMVMEKMLGRRPPYLALPYGEYNQLILDEAKSLGFEAAFTQNPGAVGDDTDLFMIPREPILGKDWSTLKHFATVLAQRDLPLADPLPAIQPLKDPFPRQFSARILHPDRYREGTYSIYVSELGGQKARVDGDRIFIDNDRPLTRRSNRVMVSAREKNGGHTAVRYWLLLTQ